MPDTESITGLEARISPRKTSWVVGGLTALVLAAGGIAAALWPSNTPSTKPAAAVHAEEKSDRYKKAASKYVEQVEIGRKHVAEKYGIPTDEVEAVVLDEIQAGRGPQKLLPLNQPALFAVYKDQNGYTSLILTSNRDIYEYGNSRFCDEKVRDAINLVRNHKRVTRKGKEEFGLSPAIKLTPKECHSYGVGDDCEAFATYSVEEWHGGMRGENPAKFYIANLQSRQVQQIKEFFFRNMWYCE